MKKTSVLSRTLKLAEMAAKIGIKEVRSGNLHSRIEQAVILAEGLAQMKGAAMKAGQLLSLDLVDYFPKEAVEILSRLHSNASAEDFAKITAILIAELGPEKYASLTNIEPNPVGTASIGQVHRAQFDNQNIVLKVQHSGIADSIESDLRVLSSMAKAFCAVTGRNMDLEPLFKEFRFILEQEVNYLKEAELQSEYRHLAMSLTDVEGLNYVVPKVLHEFSTNRVLAMEWQPGQSLRRWLEQIPLKQKREKIAHGLLNLYFHEFFRWGLVQTDPNQGNFLIHEDSGQINFALLDFGATRSYSREFIGNYVQLLQAAAKGDRTKLREYAIAFHLIDARESMGTFEAFFDVITVAVRPFFTSESFDFSNEAHLRKSQETTKILASLLKYSPPPYELVFLHRKLGGVYAFLKSLGVTLDVSIYWNKMIET